MKRKENFNKIFNSKEKEDLIIFSFQEKGNQSSSSFTNFIFISIIFKKNKKFNLIKKFEKLGSVLDAPH